MFEPHAKQKNETSRRNHLQSLDFFSRDVHKTQVASLSQGHPTNYLRRILFRNPQTPQKFEFNCSEKLKALLSSVLRSRASGVLQT